MSFTGFLSDRQAGTTAQPATSSELFNSTSFKSSASDASSSSSASASSSSSSFTPDAPRASDLFSSSNFDAAKLHPLAGLGDQLDYLLLDDAKVAELPGGASALPSRGWSDELCYGTGTTYLSGLVLGGAWGFKEGFSRDLGTSNTLRLRLNSILNGCTRRGSFFGNSAGVLAIFYNGVNSSIDAFRGKHDLMGGIISGAVSGGLFKMTAGLKPAATGAALMAGASGIWGWGKRALL